MRFKFSDDIKQPEADLRLRGLTFAAQSLSILALAYVTQLLILWPLGSALLAGGHVWAYRTREKPRKWARWGLFIALHLAFCNLIIGIGQAVPYPQAVFAVVAMGIVSFELFSRLNLYSGLGMGMVNMYTAATLSRDITFGLFLISYVVIMLAFLWIADAIDGERDNKHILRVPGSEGVQGIGRGVLRWGIWFAVAMAIAAPLIFLVTPRFYGRPLFMPVTLTVPTQIEPKKQIINPAVPLVRIEGRDTPDANAIADPSEYYFGFSDVLDLSYRGGLTDTLMFYVASPAWSYWRGYAFDEYDGLTWRQSRDYIIDVEPAGRARFAINQPRGEQFVQTFYIQQSMPNVLWTGGEPAEIYFPAERIGLDYTYGVRVGEPLTPGFIYSVVSNPVNYPPEALRYASRDDRVTEPDFWRRMQGVVENWQTSDGYDFRVKALYLQLPDTITERTHDLARQLTEGMTNDYDRVVAIRDYLLETYPYDLYPPPQAPNTDAVDQFLFVDQRGYCEHYVSAMVVMLRSLEIPSRFVVGYGSGDYNPITGFYEVRANHAHAWVEVYFPQYGWVPFDPTPGWERDPQTGGIARWFLSDLFEGVELPEISLGAIAEAGGAVLSAISTPLFIMIIMGIAGGIVYAVWRVYDGQKRKRGKRYHTDPTRRAIFRLYRRAQRRVGTQRKTGQTVREHANEHPELAEIAEIVEAAAYRPQPPEPGLLERIRQWFKRR